MGSTHNEERARGSGHFGEWVTDSFGLPAYRYTCDQRTDPRAVSPVNPVWRGPRDHSHQVGNDRLVAVASNYGYVQVRQDEGAPKFLNDYDPAHGEYAGGFGYLTDGQTTLSTFYAGAWDAFERTFGMGYYRKLVRKAGCAADQVIFAPFGDDPLLISQVTIANRGDRPSDLRWIEYWGCQPYQFSARAWVLATIERKPATAARVRREMGRRFTHAFTTAAGRGLVESKRFLGWRTSDRIRWALAQVAMATVGRKYAGGMVRPPVREAGLDDHAPPGTFLVSLDAPPDGFGTDSRAFFGKGGIENPDGLGVRLPGRLDTSGPGSALLLERRLRLQPGECRTLYFSYGYLPNGFDLDELLSRYAKDADSLWSRSSAAWHQDRPLFIVPDEPWVERETTWHHAYLRGNLTYDEFFQDHILSQGHVYQYVIGFQGAARDAAQHALPFVCTDPRISREIIRFILKEVTPQGEIPYAITGRGMRLPVPYRPSDQELWLLWLASEYVLATKDFAFLQEVVPTYPLYGSRAGNAPVGDLLDRCYRHLAEGTGCGSHGLIRLSNGDWNDLVVIGYVPPRERAQVRRVGESVLNAAMASYVLDLYGTMLAAAGRPAPAEAARRLADQQREAVRTQWTGRWFKRAWLSPSLGWVGEDVVWLEPQPWAVIGGAASAEQARALVQAIQDEIRSSSPFGARLLSAAPARVAEEAGEGPLTGVWPSINGTLVWALSEVDAEMAWDEWKRNTLCAHADCYPDIWYGIWSGPDAYNSTLSKYPGQTGFDERFLTDNPPDAWFGFGANWTDFPVMNMHPHAWPLYSAQKLLGIRFTPEGLELSPRLPKPAYRFETPLVGLVKSENGYSGWYQPAAPGRWTVVLRLPHAEARRLTRLLVNGGEQLPCHREDGALECSGESAPGSALRWAITP